MTTEKQPAAAGKDRKKKRRFRKAFARLLQFAGGKKHHGTVFSGPLHSVAILAQEKLGDAILLTPLIGNLRTAFPGLSIHVIVFSRAVCDFFRCDQNITAVHQAKKNLFSYARSVLLHRFDLLFNTKDHPSTHFLIQSLIIPARFKAGIANPYHEGLFDCLIELDYHTHIVRKNCALLELLNIKPSGEACRPYIPAMPASKETADFASSILPGTVTGVNISAGGSLRYWTEQKWSELIGCFPEEQFVIFSAPQDSEQKQRLEQRLPNVIPSPPTANLFEVGMLVRQLKLLITPDTSLVHVASCFAVPVIGLYREAPQDISRFAPYMTRYELVVSQTSQVSDIAVEKVASALRLTLQACMNRNTSYKRTTE
jgi:ADP-heptose:LPS heptosyltransferase